MDVYSSCQMEQDHLLPVMKSTKVQNPRRILRLVYANARERKLGTPLIVDRARPPLGVCLVRTICMRTIQRCRFLDPEQHLFSEIATLVFERLLR